MLFFPFLSSLVSTDQEVAKYLGVRAEEIKIIIRDEKLDEIQITIAAVISKKSEQPLKKVVSDQKKYQNWEELSLHYHLTPEEIWEELREYFPRVIWYPRVFSRNPKLLAQVLSIYLSEDDRELLSIIQKEDYSMVSAAILAKISGKKLSEILQLKEKMSWEELKEKLKIHPTQIIDEQKRLKQILYQELER